MRKYLKINAGKDHIFQVLTDVAQWTEWWPGFKNANVLERRGNGFVAEVATDMKIGGKMTIDIDHSQPDVVVYRQIKGWFKAYSNSWTLLPDQQGAGTTIKVAIEISAGALVSKRMLHDKLAQSLSQAEHNLNKLLQNASPLPQAAPSPETAPKPTHQAGQKPIHVFPTAKGLEVWVSGRRYIMKYAGWSKENPDILPAP